MSNVDGMIDLKESAGKAMQLHEDMIEALREAALQIEYLHEKFQKTGTGETVLARIRMLLARAEAK